MLDEEAQHSLLGADLVVGTVVLVMLIVVSIVAERRRVPASAALLVFGGALGAALRLSGLDAELDLTKVVLFNEELFLYALLPPVIFDAGFSLQKRPFLKQLGTILLFAVGGTLATTFAIGGVLYAAGAAGAFTEDGGAADALDFRTPLDAYLFGALISATDPVATLSIMGSVGAEPQVYALVFGESVLNDAVAIVLVRILQNLGTDSFTHPLHFLPGILQFAIVSLGSIAVGTIVSATSALLLKQLRHELRHHAPFALSLLFLFAYVSFCAAEAVGCSGILALFITGVLESHYHVTSISPSARDAAAVALKAAAHLCEAAIFAYIGLDLIDSLGAEEIDADAPPDNAAATATAPSAESGPAIATGPGRAGFVAFSVALVLLARLLVVPPMCMLANRFRSRRIDSKMGAALVCAGLRGAIAFALAKNVRSVHRDNIAAATSATVLFTTFVIGGLTRPILGRLGMISPRLPPADADAEPLAGSSAQAAHVGHLDARSGQNLPPPVTPGRRPSAKSPRDKLSTSLARRWLRLDADVLRPLFGADDPLLAVDGSSSGSSAGSDERPPRPQSSPLVSSPPAGPAGTELMPVPGGGEMPRCALEPLDARSAAASYLAAAARREAGGGEAPSK